MDKRSKQGGPAVRVPPPLVFVALIALGLLLQRNVRRLSVGLPPAPRLILGGLLFFIGAGVGVAALKQFRRSGRENPLPWHPSPELIIQGVYRRTRNPMYLSETVQMLGIGLAANCAWILLFAPVLLLILHFTAVLPEERYMAETFGESYQRYRETVRRYI